MLKLKCLSLICGQGFAYRAVLTKHLIEYVPAQDSSGMICYFFFKGNQEQNSAATVICAPYIRCFVRRLIFCRSMQNGYEVGTGSIYWTGYNANLVYWDLCQNDDSRSGDQPCSGQHTVGLSEAVQALVDEGEIKINEEVIWVASCE